MLTPSETRASSPTPTERPNTTDPRTPSQEHMETQSTPMMTAEQCKAMLNFKAFLAKDHMRDWVNKKGMFGKVSEQEIDELVEKMF